MAIPLFFVGSAARAASVAAVRIAGLRGAKGFAARGLLRNLPDAMLGLSGKAEFQWHGDEFSKMLISVMQQRLDMASMKMYNYIYWKISIPVEINDKGHETRSKPGQYPRMDTSRLRTDLFREFDKELSVVIGSRIYYSLILEFSLRRSWLRRGFNEYWPKSRRILLYGPPPMRTHGLLGPLGMGARSRVKGTGFKIRKAGASRVRRAVSKAAGRSMRTIQKRRAMTQRASSRKLRARQKVDSKNARVKQRLIKRILTKPQGRSR